MNKENYAHFILNVKDQILRSRYLAAHLVNRELLMLYFKIGKQLSDKIAQEKWGTKVVEQISTDLQKELPGLRGFSYRNLMNMKQFAEQYMSLPFLQLATAEMSNENPINISSTIFLSVGFTHHMKLISRCKNMVERIFYMTQAAENHWTIELLDFQIDAQLYHKQGKLPNNFKKALPDELLEKALLAFKDEYLLDFINVETDDEREIEKSIIQNIKHFVLTMGKGFAFIGNQHRLVIEDEEYFIDLLFYNRILQSLVAFDLKRGKFKPKDLGQLNFYLNVLNSEERLSHENPSVGILLCREKKDTIVEFAFQGLENPMGVATYKISPDMPDSLKQVLPDAEALKKLLE